MLNQDYESLLVRYFSGEANAQERVQIEIWRDASSENQNAFAEALKIWQNATEEQSLHVPSVDQSWRDLETKLGLPNAQSRGRILEMTKPRATAAPAWLYAWRGRSAWAVAALLVLIFGSLLYKSWNSSPGLQTIAAANAEQIQHVLPDGSTVTLNCGSTLQYAQDFTREVALSGEAFFEVAHDSAHPFVVNTVNAQIKVLGTKFNIWSREEETRVIVREGRVALRGGENRSKVSVELRANETSACRQAQPPTPVRTIDAGHALGWLQGKIVFEQAALSEVIAELQRVYNLKIALADAGLRSHTITGAFNRKPIASVLASICLTLNLQYRQESGGYIIFE